MVRTFMAPGRIVTGRGSLASLGAEAARLGRRALVVTGRRFARRSGLLDRALALLTAAGLDALAFDGVTPEPTLDEVEEARRLARAWRCDVVVGLGGGSAIDVAKAAAALVREAAPAAEFHAGRAIQAAGLPTIAVPTTAGTGAEATPNSVVTDAPRRVKRSIRGPSLLPAVAIVDPEATAGADLALTAHAGMDALTQAVESHVSRHAYSLTRALSRQAVALLGRALSRLAERLDDPDAREDAAMGSLMAGVSLANARLGVVHGVAHALGARYGIPHGRVCGILLPHSIRLNAEAAAEGYADLAAAVHAPGRLAEFVDRLLTTLGMPPDLKAYRIPRDDIPALVAESRDTPSTQANPRELSNEDLTAFLTAVI